MFLSSTHGWSSRQQKRRCILIKYIQCVRIEKRHIIVLFDWTGIPSSFEQSFQRTLLLPKLNHRYYDYIFSRFTAAKQIFATEVQWMHGSHTISHTIFNIRRYMIRYRNFVIKCRHFASCLRIFHYLENIIPHMRFKSIIFASEYRVVTFLWLDHVRKKCEVNEQQKK